MSAPLTGIRVLDLSRVLAGPLATQMLAELGADVIKVERPNGGDESRVMEPRLDSDESAYFFAVNRSKRSIAVDLKSAGGRRVILDLVRHSDVVVENFLPGTLDRMGLGFDDLRAANPAVILVSNTGFGQTGPENRTKGYDTVFQALSGVMHLTGHPEGGPAKVGVPIADMTSSLWILIACLVGVIDRNRTGQGSHWDVAMMDVQASLLAISSTRLFAHDEDLVRTGTQHPGRVPSAAFECADGRWVHLSASDQHWQPICEVFGLGQEAREQWATNAARVADRDAVMELLGRQFAHVDHTEVIDNLSARGIPIGLVQTPREALNSPQALHRDTVQTFDHPTAGPFAGITTPLRRTGETAPPMKTPPLLGQDTQDILTNVLNLDSEQVEALYLDEAVSDRNPSLDGA